MVSAGPHEVRAARPRRPAPARPRAPLTRSWTILTIKERASACREESPGLAGPALREEQSAAAAAHSGAPERPRRCRLAPQGQGRVLTAGAQQQRPLCPAGWPGVGAFLGKLALGHGGRAREVGWEWGSAFLRGSRGRAKARALAVLKLRAGPTGRRVPSSGLTGRASAAGPWRALRLPPRPGRTQW